MGLPDYNYEKAVENNEQRDKLIVNNQRDVDTERAHRVLSLKGRTGLPYDVLDADLDNIERKANYHQFDPDEYIRESPNWAKFAADNPFHLSVLKADQKNLTAWERAMKPIKQANFHSWAMQERSELGVRQREQGGELDEKDAARLKELEKYAVDHDFGTTGFHSLVVAGVKQSANFIGAWREGMKVAAVSGPAFALAGAKIGAGAGTMIAPGGGTLGGGGAGMVAGWGVGITAGMLGGGFKYTNVLEGGSAYLEYKGLGFSHEDAAWASEVAGNINGLFEVAGGNIIFSKLPGVKNVKGMAGKEILKRLLARKTAVDALKAFGKDYGIANAAELATEVAQEATTITLGEVLKVQNDRDDFLTGPQIFDRIGDIAVETLKSTVLITGVGPGQRVIADGMQVRRAQQMEQAIKALGEAGENSELRQKNAPIFREFAHLTAEDGPVENFLVDVDQFDTYWQEIGQDPDAVAQELHIDNLEEARLIGMPVEIPVAEYAEKIASIPQHREALTKHTKVRDEDITPVEAAEIEKQYPEMIKRMEEVISGEEQVDTSIDAKFQEDIIGMLVAANTDPDTARKMAVAAQGVINLGKRFYNDPTKFADRVLDVKSVPEAALLPKDVDGQLSSLLNLLREHKGPTAQALRGVTLLEFLKKRGGLLDQGGELSARDLQLEMKGLVTKQGKTLDDAAEAAAEAGYIAEGDINMLIEAIEREKRGEAAPGIGADPQAIETQAQLDNLEGLLGTLGLDLDKMSNEEIAKTLDAMETFNQDSEVGADAIAEILVSEIEEVQDFGDVKLTDTHRIQETGKDVKVTQPASTIYNRAVKRRNVVKQLMDCVSG